MQQRLKRYDVTFWANDFVNELEQMRKLSHSINQKKLSPEIEATIINHYRNSQKRIIITNYDRILVPYEKEFEDISPNPELIQILKNLTEKDETDVLINSGRNREYMDRYFENLSLNITAEHGTWIKESDSNKWVLLQPASAEWKKEILPILEIYTDRVPGAAIEEKDFSITWHYNKGDIEQSSLLAKELVDNLLSITQTANIQVEIGHRAVEVFHAGIDRSEIVGQFIAKKEYDFILAIGNNWSDELLFETLPKHTYSLSVGNIHTKARYMVKDQVGVLRLIKNLYNPT